MSIETTISSIQEDIEFAKSILPNHYVVEESKTKDSIHCKSETGFVKPPYEDYRGLITDAEDEIAWASFKCTTKAYFGNRFQEVYHNTCFCHIDFTIYLKPCIAVWKSIKSRKENSEQSVKESDTTNATRSI
jgi:hypothetical protein